MSSTFKVSDVEIKHLSNCYWYKDAEPRLIPAMRYQSKIDEDALVLSRSNLFRGNRFIKPYAPHGLTSTLLSAYNYHIPVTLRPDDIWTSITTAFGQYVTTYSEEMRNFFVGHEGQKELEIKVGGSLDTWNSQRGWEVFCRLMTEKIAENVKNDVMSWSTTSFSTSATIDRLISSIVLMNTMSEYFTYKGTMLCGLPEVTLEGSLEDWKLIRAKAGWISQFGGRLEEWVNVLLPVLDEFINAYQGDVNLDFWERAATNERRGSGGQRTLSGWVLAFTPFNEKGDYVLYPTEAIKSRHTYGSVDDDDIPSSLISVPMIINDNGTVYKAQFCAGLNSLPVYNEERNMLHVSSDWALFAKLEE